MVLFSLVARAAFNVRAEIATDLIVSDFGAEALICLGFATGFPLDPPEDLALTNSRFWLVRKDHKNEEE